MREQQPLTSDNLEAAFAVFNQMSTSLGESYRDLESCVSELILELVEVRNERTRELAEKEKLANRLSTLLSVLPGGVVTLNQQLFVTDLNPEAVELLGIEILVGKHWPSVLKQLIKQGDSKSHDLHMKNGKRLSLCDRSNNETLKE